MSSTLSSKNWKFRKMMFFFTLDDILSVISLFLMLLPLTDKILLFEIRPKQECLVGDYHL